MPVNVESLKKLKLSKITPPLKLIESFGDQSKFNRARSSPIKEETAKATKGYKINSKKSFFEKNFGSKEEPVARPRIMSNNSVSLLDSLHPANLISLYIISPTEASGTLKKSLLFSSLSLFVIKVKPNILSLSLFLSL